MTCRSLQSRRLFTNDDISTSMTAIEIKSNGLHSMRPIHSALIGVVNLL